MKKIKVLLIGATGRMGLEIAALVPSFKGISISCGVASQVSELPFPICRQLKDVKPKNVDLVIDFSAANFFSEVVDWCSKNKKPLVSGTTGISSAHHKLLLLQAKKIPIFWSANMSLGVAFLQQVLKQMSLLEDFQFQIEEVHHRHKIDRPSGTALALQKTLQSVIKSELPEPISIRGGGVFGMHRVLVMGEEEVLSFEHNALNRRVFARGALRAALWLFKQKPGMYTMDDCLAENGLRDA